ncbi:hypothetical protein, partial [Ileibacterium valens]
AGLRLILAMISFPLFLIKAQIAKKICAGRAVRSRLTQIKLHSLNVTGKDVYDVFFCDKRAFKSKSKSQACASF